jgi:hypothetical protein
MTNAQWLETLLPLSRNSEDTETVVNINHEALENIRKFLLASGVDPGAVLRGERKRAEASPDVRGLAEALCGEFEGAVREAEYRQNPRGMHVSFHGEFASAIQLPSFVARARWWARELRQALDVPPAAPPALTELRELAKRWEGHASDVRSALSWNEGNLDRGEAQQQTLSDCASELTAALDAMGAKK